MQEHVGVFFLCFFRRDKLLLGKFGWFVSVVFRRRRQCSGAAYVDVFIQVQY